MTIPGTLPPAGLKCKESPGGLTVSGEVDLYTAPAFAAALMPPVEKVVEATGGGGAWRDFVLDMTGCTFIDSAGLGVIVTAARLVRGKAGHLSRLTLTVAANSQPRRVLLLMRIEALLTLETVTETVAETDL